MPAESRDSTGFGAAVSPQNEDSAISSRGISVIDGSAGRLSQLKL